MKRLNKFFLIIGALFVTVNLTLAIYNSTGKITNNFSTKKRIVKIKTSGGVFSNNSITIRNNKTTLPTPTRDGYKFIGYSITEDGDINFSPTINNVKEIEDREIYAKWEKLDYGITYNLNGGTITGQATTYDIEKTVTLPTPTKAGYEFTGWTGSNGTTPSKTVTIPKGSTGNKFYTANWKIIDYTLSYNLDGGTITGQPKSYNIEESVTLPTPTRAGYEFTGWTGSNGTTPSKTVTIPKGSTGNKSFTANWKITNYTISYNLNGGTITGQQDSYNVEKSVTLPTPTRAGYEFTGWTGSNGTTPNKTVTIPKDSTGNKTYTANWKITSYTINYVLNGGTANNPTIYDINTNTFKLTNPTKRGYKFLGWTGSNGTTANSNVSIAKGSTGNKSYTANWSKINATSTGVTIYAYRSEDYGNTYGQWSKGPWGKYYASSVRISDVGTWDLVVSNNYVELKGTTVVISENRCYKLEVYAGNNGRNGEFLGSDTECTVNENNNTTSKAYLKVGW